MFYLTDHPERTRCFLPAEGGWDRCDAGELDGDEHDVWKLLGTGGELWRCGTREAPENAAEKGGGVVLIDEAGVSQFDAVVGALQGGATFPDGLRAVALAGSNFHGQRQRQWQALRGNLHLTVHYPFRARAAEVGPALTMLPAVAAARTVAEVTGEHVRPTLKWVNDVLVGGRKVGGVLTATQVEGDEIADVVFGIGMNVDAKPVLAEIVGGMVGGAGAICDFAELRDSLPTVYRSLVKHLDEAMATLSEAGPREIYEAYRGFAGFIGREVRIWAEGEGVGGEPIAAGRVTELLPDLALIVEGQVEPVRRGRMELVETSL
ncbi:MAG: hypothetical protein WD294_09185 [Phycisphaeraceae bacterium]